MKKITQIFLFLLLLIAIFTWAQIAKSPTADTSNTVSINFLDVGQGDSILIQKGSFQILIDGGPSDSLLSEIGKIMPSYDRKIEEVILTHPHADHLVGLNQIIPRYEISKIYYSKVSYESNAYTEFTNLLNEKEILLSLPKIGQEEIPFDNATINFLWPGNKYEKISLDNLNNSSEVVKFCYFQYCALFLGDLETDAQAAMFSQLDCHPELVSGSHEVSDTCDFKSDILKISHHGSTNGTNQILIDMVQPKFAVIEVGADNKFGHPHSATISLLDKNQIKHFRTDRDGTVRFHITESGVTKK